MKEAAAANVPTAIMFASHGRDSPDCIALLSNTSNNFVSPPGADSAYNSKHVASANASPVVPIGFSAPDSRGEKSSKKLGVTSQRTSDLDRPAKYGLVKNGHFSARSMYVCMYVCMYGHTYSRSMDQPGKVANPAGGQLNRENGYFPVRVRAWKFGLARQVRQSRPASACSSPYSSWIWCLLTGFLPPEFRGGLLKRP